MNSRLNNAFKLAYLLCWLYFLFLIIASEPNTDALSDPQLPPTLHAKLEANPKFKPRKWQRNKPSGILKNIMLSNGVGNLEKCKYVEENHPKMDEKTCMIVGSSTYNFLVTFTDNEDYYTCISRNKTYYKDCKNKDFLPENNDVYEIPVLPIMKVENKRLLEIGNKYFATKSTGRDNILLQSVKLSGDCNISRIDNDDYFSVMLETKETKVGVVVKEMGETNLDVTTFSGSFRYQLDESKLDGNHFLICGDQFHHLPDLDSNVRKCIHRYPDNKSMQYICSNFWWIKWAFLFFIIMVPVTWFLKKSYGALSLWYDLISILLYPVLYFINYAWTKVPYRCDMCGYLCLLGHECPEKCICNRSESGEDHTSECYFTRGFPKKPFRKFQFLMNTGLTKSLTLYITRFLVSSLIISMLPNSLALTANCGYNCYADLDSSKFIHFGFDSGLDVCSCEIMKENDGGEFPFKVTETFKGYNGKVQTSVSRRKCQPDFNDDCEEHLETEVSRIIACHHGCETLKSYIYDPVDKVHELYNAHAYGKIKPIELYHLRRARDGMISNETVFDKNEPSIGMWGSETTKMANDIAYSENTNITDIPETNMLSRETLMYASKVDNKYRYLIEQDLISDTGTIFEMIDGTASRSKKMMIYHKNVGLTYTIRYLYTTSDIASSKVNLYSTCTGDCEKCWSENPEQQQPDHHRFCIEPTSQWGCEDFMCAAMNTGATCGHCENIYDLSTALDIYIVDEVHISATTCINLGKGYECFNQDDKKATTRDRLQSSITPTLQNNYVSTGHKIAISGDGSIYTGNIADYMSADLVFGHPQISKTGRLLFAETYIDQSQLSWTCDFIGPKKVNIKRCGFYTYDHLSGLEKINENAYKIVDKNKIMMSKDYSLGKIKTIIDLPIEVFAVQTETPKITSVDHSCIGCVDCFKGLSCDYRFSSNKHFSARLESPDCVFKHPYVIIDKGQNKLTLNPHCSAMGKGTVIKLIVEDNDNISVELSMTKITYENPDKIENSQDHEIQTMYEHHEDTDFHTFLEAVTYPFNWVAHFTNSALDFLKVAILIVIVIIIIYIISKFTNLGKEAFKHAKKYMKKNKDKVDEYISDEEEEDRLPGEHNLVKRMKVVYI